MQHLKLTIQGAYYDTQIYSGRLYLWCQDNSIRVIDWDKLINLLIEKDRASKFALECGFRRSEYLYGTYWKLFFEEPSIKNFISNSFDSLAARSIVVSEKLLSEVEIKHQDNPMPFPHSDSTIYNNRLYVASPSGIFGSTCNKKNVYPVSLRSKCLLDIPCVGISASYNSLAISAGQEGLIELSLDHELPWWKQGNNNNDRYYILSESHSSSSHWTYYSIFSSSYISGGYMAEFSKHYETEALNGDLQSFNDNVSRGEYPSRRFNRIIPGRELFNANGNSYSWGRQDKLCQVNGNVITVIQYVPWDKDQKFIKLGELHLRAFKGNVVSGDSALFGFVIEYDNGIVVMDSNLDNIWIPEEPINWRVFPNSKYYENHLHIVYPDRLDINSFNDDYFVNQDEKKAGIKYLERRRPRSRYTGRISY